MRKEVAMGGPDPMIAGIAGTQHGVVTFEQLISAGLSPPGITRRVKAGRLHRLHRGLYAVGHTDLANEGFWMAAVLACGLGAVLSHRSAAYLWKMLKPVPGPVHVTVPTRGGRARREGLIIHRATLLPSQTTHRARIPVTKPTRTLTDLRRIATPGEYRRALRQAEFDRRDLADLGQNGTRSENEGKFLALCHRHRVPLPEVNQELGPYTVDFLWRAERLVVETDSWSAHGGRLAYTEDRERDLWLKLRGFEVVRFTYEQVTGRPTDVAADLRALLSARSR